MIMHISNIVNDTAVKRYEGSKEAVKKVVHVKINSLEKIIAKRNWSFRDLAKRAGISPATISRWKNEQVPVSASSRRKLMDTLPGCNFNRIFLIKTVRYVDNASHE
jgi:ribosome-binding protein aMBF1 (putative translation factor)